MDAPWMLMDKLKRQAQARSAVTLFSCPKLCKRGPSWVSIPAGLGVADVPADGCHLA